MKFRDEKETKLRWEVEDYIEMRERIKLDEKKKYNWERDRGREREKILLYYWILHNWNQLQCSKFIHFIVYSRSFYSLIIIVTRDSQCLYFTERETRSKGQSAAAFSFCSSINVPHLPFNRLDGQLGMHPGSILIRQTCVQVFCNLLVQKTQQVSWKVQGYDGLNWTRF